ncbi:hypothetical protein HNR46_001309 [Haloferula luteola]|uniref:Uncharacterized protein n=1 Tax=Haloferula luteola TaxID=595692 RepID=A0A840UZA7_9BACT|nr:hypothetical protein [Haloferula luteola]MBB5351075.1 hypothetical protein [Haloferula luteola]
MPGAEPLFYFLPLLAEIGGALPDPESPQTVGWLLLSLAAVVATGDRIMSGMLNWRKLKGADAAEHSQYVTKPEHHALKEDVSNLDGRVTSIERTLTSEMQAIHRALGRIEGKLGTK